MGGGCCLELARTSMELGSLELVECCCDHVSSTCESTCLRLALLPRLRSFLWRFLLYVDDFVPLSSVVIFAIPLRYEIGCFDRSASGFRVYAFLAHPGRHPPTRGFGLVRFGSLWFGLVRFGSVRFGSGLFVARTLRCAGSAPGTRATVIGDNGVP